MANLRGPHDRSDGGFTLVELLIVIVVLGVLATVTVFAVRGITERGSENACTTELRTLDTAQSTYFVLAGAYADEAGLVSGGAIKDESSMYEVTLVGADGYRVEPAAGSSCTGVATGGGGPAIPAGPPAPPIPPVGGPPPSPIIFGGYQAWEFGAGGADEVLVIGGLYGTGDWLTMIADVPATSRRVTFINLSEITDSSDIDAMMSRSRTTGVTDFAVYAPDDVSPLALSGGGTAPSVADYLASQAGSDPFHVLGPGSRITDLLVSIG